VIVGWVVVVVSDARHVLSVIFITINTAQGLKGLNI
jgi:hypothetical protein